MKIGLMAVALAMAAVALAAFGAALYYGEVPPPNRREIRVFAASSLRGVFQEVGGDIERLHGVNVLFNFAGSHKLMTQIIEGVPADVYASADWRQMERAIKAGLIREGEVYRFARNSPVIIVPAGNPAAVRSLDDLARPGLRVVLGAPEAPIGSYARAVLEKVEHVEGGAASGLGGGGGYRDFEERVQANVVSYEMNVAQVAAKVATGNVDAGIVYRTDALALGSRVEVISIPPEVSVDVEYYAGILLDSPHPEEAQRFLEFLLSTEGRETLNVWGFR